MAEKAMKTPGPTHPIAIGPAHGRVVVRVAGRTVASSDRALELREAAYPPVFYLPRADVEVGLLEPSDHTTYCPYKGDCRYWTIVVGDRRCENAVWGYDEPFPAVAAIRDHVAFYPDRVDGIEAQEAVEVAQTSL